MNEPRAEQWMERLAESIFPKPEEASEYRQAWEMIGWEHNYERALKLIAQHAPPDCERELRELADELGDHVKLTVNPSVQPLVALRWRDEETCDQRAVVGNTIPAAIRAAREAMGR